MIADILPDKVACRDAFDDSADCPLFPEEEALLVRSVDKRRREFTTARFCARAALGELGLPPVPLVPGERGAPQWPSGIVGSMTHCAGYRAAAVGHATDIVTIGIDAEPHEVLPAGVLDVIVRPEEAVRLRRLADTTPEVCWDRLLFSAKESVYKAWFPLARRWLGFEDADLTIDPTDGTFTARLLVAGPVVNNRPITELTGRWLARDGFVLTAIALPTG
ncbi:4'-phosphopantetheinyl transferase superfamily protein [Frankia sp. Cppng1_Ct_nod]|uniref:4'-phosphopantetheinyl transferase family protein n=1 Tax=Frankia sp. Cppng1_Ct_nod TaxID=2897162 RepID=UPI001040E15E|nr:4'-phosphopantetheinyl transferase superfamily protein [Frankia sp. Cppng1_Ct_nod]